MTLTDIKDRALGWLLGAAITAQVGFNTWSANEHSQSPTRDEVKADIRDAPFPYLEDRGMLLAAVRRNEERQMRFMERQTEVVEKLADAVTALKVEMAKIGSHLER